PGRPSRHAAIKALVIRMAQENSTWGYDRIVGALANLGHRISDQTIGNILKRHGIVPTQSVAKAHCDERCSSSSSIIIASGTIRERETRYCFLRPRRKRLAEVSAAGTVSAACCDITAGPLEYVDPTGSPGF